MREEVLMLQASPESTTSLVPGSDLKIAALVCVATFAPDKREPASTRIAYVYQPKAIASIIEAVRRISHD